jgi:hypothetical protein
MAAHGVLVKYAKLWAADKEDMSLDDPANKVQLKVGTGIERPPA